MGYYEPALTNRKLIAELADGQILTDQPPGLIEYYKDLKPKNHTLNSVN